jgi:hypothetical protein
MKVLEDGYSKIKGEKTEYDTNSLLEENRGNSIYGQLYGDFFDKYPALSQKTFWEYLEDLKAAGKIDYSDMYIAGMQDHIKITLKRRTIVHLGEEPLN